ncbi:MAG: response regulator [Betaproteobacteria bacterium]|nr:response regulator [Betaproteobacteria bacterium]
MNNLSYATTSCSKGLILDTVNRTAITVVDVVVIEDHPLYVEALLSLLSVALSGRKIERFRDIESAEPLLRVANPTVILLDLMLPGLRGTDALDVYVNNARMRSWSRYPVRMTRFRCRPVLQPERRPLYQRQQSRRTLPQLFVPLSKVAWYHRCGSAVRVPRIPRPLTRST